MHEDTIYRCVNPDCARLMPRPVKFCPWCGTAQATGRAPERDVGPGAAAAPVQPPQQTSSAAGRADWSDVPQAQPHLRPAAADVPARADARVGADARTSAGTDAGAAAGADAAPRPAARGARLGTLFDHGARASKEAQSAAQSPAPADSVPRPAIPPRPAKPQRHPIRLRWWIAVLLILLAVWLVARPNSAKQIERRIDYAAALAKECKAREAQDELIALRKTRATPAQLERLQDALNEGAAACTRKRQRDKAWADASAAAESALADGNAERASARLQAFTRRWGDDERSRKLRARIEDARHPLAAPEG